ncbi:radical S-adenosyl methionine domain-containing protein 1 [Clydaea vesicula]|uniref:Radical S-adenosyl methionine domain-containing protein 1 n=1 Tax=Clydaea vesicula TaxID=447962 RepID=A0AAD5TZW5_9FUNG|nr:radical S-adenosyl methionine domain-containing protein 1 [Clydaea vesicula]
MLNSFKIDIDGALFDINERRMVKSIYFGGGTPSLSRPETIKQIIDYICSKSAVDKEAEITLECNPTSVELDKLKSFREAGLQSFDDSYLKFMGRDHNRELSLSSLTACDLGASQLSLYQLTLERGTPLFKQYFTNNVVPKLKLKSEEELSDFWDLTIETAERNDYLQYEISSFAKGGYVKNRSMHNSFYWNGTDYIGVGPGAHGRYTDPYSIRYRSFRVLEPNAWMSQCEQMQTGCKKTEKLSQLETNKELILFALRTIEGAVPELFFENSNGCKLEDFIDFNTLDHFVTHGYLEIIEEKDYKFGRGFKASKKGLKVIDFITKRILEACN